MVISSDLLKRLTPPFIEDLKTFSKKTLKADLLSGVSVALLAIPQAIACALVAGFPPICGLITAIFAPIFASLFGGSKSLVSGPTNATVILISYTVSEVLFNQYRPLDPAQQGAMAIVLLMQITLMCGLMQLFSALLRLGDLVKFVSYPVVVGYIVGAVAAVIANQLTTVFGLTRPSMAFSLYERILSFIGSYHQIHLPTLEVSCLSFILFFTFRRFFSNGLSVILMLSLSALFVFFSQSTIPDMDTVLLVSSAQEFGVFKIEFFAPIFDLGLINSMIPSAFAIALLGILETASVAKTIMTQTQEKICMNQQLFGLGLGNCISALFGGMPASTSPSRSILNSQNRGVSRFSVVFNGVFVAFFLMVAHKFIGYIPLASLSVLVILTVIKMISQKHLLVCLKATGSDALVLFTTMISCFFFSLDTAFYIGVIISVTLYLKKASKPELKEYGYHRTGSLLRLEENPQDQTVRVINVEGELFFGAADLFQSAIHSISKDSHQTKVIVLRLRDARDIDATTCLAILQLFNFLKKSDCQLLVCGITPSIWRVFSNASIVKKLGKENLFLDDDRDPRLTVQRALKRAADLVGSKKLCFIPLEPSLQSHPVLR